MGFAPSLFGFDLGFMDHRCRLEPRPKGSFGQAFPKGCWRSRCPPGCQGDLEPGRGAPDRQRSGVGVGGHLIAVKGVLTVPWKVHCGLHVNLQGSSTARWNRALALSRALPVVGRPPAPPTRPAGVAG
eukprot:5868898-Pyramimonas_sp.AAC.1